MHQPAAPAAWKWKRFANTSTYIHANEKRERESARENVDDCEDGARRAKLTIAARVRSIVTRGERRRASTYTHRRGRGRDSSSSSSGRKAARSGSRDFSLTIAFSREGWRTRAASAHDERQVWKARRNRIPPLFLSPISLSLSLSLSLFLTHSLCQTAPPVHVENRSPRECRRRLVHDNPGGCARVCFPRLCISLTGLSSPRQWRKSAKSVGKVWHSPSMKVADESS